MKNKDAFEKHLQTEINNYNTGHPHHQTCPFPPIRKKDIERAWESCEEFYEGRKCENCKSWNKNTNHCLVFRNYFSKDFGCTCWENK